MCIAVAEYQRNFFLVKKGRRRKHVKENCETVEGICENIPKWVHRGVHIQKLILYLKKNKALAGKTLT